MKIAALIMLIVSLVNFHYPLNSNSDAGAVKIRLSGERYGRRNRIKLPEKIVTVKEGENFGYEKMFGASEKPFKLVEIIDKSHLKIEFEDNLEVAGRTIDKETTTIISFDQVCFNTRTDDSGARFCLELLKE